MKSYPRGSEWRKWDLHMHSTASDGTLTPNQIIDIAEKEGLSVIAITDHHTVRNVDEAKHLGKERGITVISGVEFRTEYGAKSVHIIGLFPDEYDGIKLTQDAIEHLVLDNLGLSRILIETEGRKVKPESDDLNAFKQGMHSFQVDLKAAADLVHKYGGLVSVHAGNKSNSIEEMKHDGKGKRNVDDVVDSLGPVKDELLKNYIDICEIGSPNDRNAEFYIKQFGIPVITASDAHDTERLGKVFTWIKSDPTFEGLRQIKYEPELRVKIQENKPEMKADYQIIESVEIHHPDFGSNILEFNQNLNTIIGGRSSGKSILLGLIAKSANYTGDIKDKKEYNEYIDSIVSSLKITWKDKEDLANRKVEYFPQTYINGLASDSESTVKLIENILKDDEERKTAFEDYDSLISKNTVQISNAVENLLKMQYRADEVKADIISIGDAVGIATQIKKISTQIDEVKKKSTVKLSDEEEQNYKYLKDEKRQLQQGIMFNQNIEKQLLQLKGEQLVRDISGDFIGLPDDIRGEFVHKIEDISKKADTEWDEFVNSKIASIRHKIDDANKRIADIESDPRYIDGETYYKENEALTDLSKVLEDEKKKEKRIADLLTRERDIQNEITRLSESIFALQKEYLRMANELCEKVKMDKDEIHISPKVVFSQDLFAEIIDSNFLKRSNYIKNLMEYEYVDETSFFSTLSDLLLKLENDDSIIKNGKDKKQIILSLLSSNYFKLLYNVEYQGDNLDSMSEGKKAFVILRMLLDFNDNQCPILIDQPEDDLDNRAIFNDLVTYIRKKKQERQIILVTHNPNIVVTADAEEVIVANQNGIHNENKYGVKFDYVSGAIENSFKNNETTILESQGIREHICEILEGGDVAFLKRENKYQLKV